MNGWSPADLLPGVYVALLAAALAAVLRRWYDPVPRRVLALFGLLLLVLFGSALVGGRVLLPVDLLRERVPFQRLAPPPAPGNRLQADLVLQVAPWQAEVRRAVREGRWPLWNPRVGAGMPLLADPQSQALQPFAFLAWPFPLARAAGVTAALRVLVALVFTFLLLRRQGLGAPASLCGALAYGLDGFLMLWLGWPIGNNAALLPLLLYAVARCDEPGSRRDFLLLASSAATVLLGGHPETTLYVLALAAAFVLSRAVRRPRGQALGLLARCGLASLLAAGIAAPALLTARDYLPQSQRGALLAELRERGSPAGLAEALGLGDRAARSAWGRKAVRTLLPVAAPDAFGDGLRGGPYLGEHNRNDDAGGFVGTAALLAALLAAGSRRRFPGERLMAGTLLACLLLLAQPPGLWQRLATLPLVGATALHQHRRVLLLVAFCLAYLAACTTERAIRGEGRPLAGALALVAVGVLVAWAYLAHPDPRLAGFHTRSLALQLAALLAAGVALVPRWRVGSALPAWALGAAIAVELVAVHGRIHAAMPARLAYPPVPALDFLARHLGPSRMVGLGGALPANVPSIYGLADARIDNPAMPAAYARAVAPLRRGTWGLRYVGARHPLYDLLGVRWVLAPPGLALGLPLAYAGDDARVYRRPGALPRLFLPASARVDRRGRWAARLAGNRDFGRDALVEHAPGGRWRARSAEASALGELRLTAARVSARARLAEPRLLATGIQQDGGWRLLVGGERRPTVLTNGMFAGAWLPAGEHRLDLLYRPAGLLRGCALAALALAAGLAWWLPPPRRFLPAGPALP